jgi:Flp pilus assembly protein TadD
MAVRCVAAIAFMTLAASASAEDDPNELYRLGMRLFSDNQPDAAIDAFKRVVELRPKNAAGWKALGVVYAAQRNFDAAEKPLHTACDLNPALPDACVYYARTLYLLNRFRPAIEVLRRALVTDRQNAEIQRLLGLSLEGLGDAEEAGKALREAVRLDRGLSPNEDPGIDYGVYLFRLGRAEEALAPIETALAHHPGAARAHLELGCVLLSLDRLTEAEPHLERAVALDPQSSRAHLLLGKVYLRLGRVKAGEEQLSQGSRTVK